MLSMCNPTSTLRRHVRAFSRILLSIFQQSSGRTQAPWDRATAPHIHPGYFLLYHSSFATMLKVVATVMVTHVLSTIRLCTEAKLFSPYLKLSNNTSTQTRGR